MLTALTVWFILVGTALFLLVIVAIGQYSRGIHDRVIQALALVAIFLLLIATSLKI